MIIKINVANKRPTVDGTPLVVCGNSDYQIQFTFDEEWDGLTYKTARFVFISGGKPKYIDVPFAGDTVDVPILAGVNFVLVGLYTDTIKTTTPARIVCETSIRCNSGESVQVPAPDLYDQLMELYNRVAQFQEPALEAAQEATAAIEQVRAYAETAQECAEDAVLATTGKQNKLAWVTEADIEAMLAGTYEGTEDDDPEMGTVEVYDGSFTTEVL